MSKICELVLFTTKEEEYANHYIKKNNLISHRRYSDSLWYADWLWYAEKRIDWFGRDLKKTIIVDVSPDSFASNPGQPISPLFYSHNQ
jgi:TFIIF-interacting CTD phosphatase-like protein